jgi:glycine C-acetyltransferase
MSSRIDPALPSVTVAGTSGSRAAGVYPLDHADGSDGPISLSSNNYLGLSRHPAVVAATQEAIATYGVGAGGSRAAVETGDLFQRLERAISDFKGLDATLVFQSGFAANLGAIPALVGPEDLLIHDEANHASCADGARLSGATVLTYRHRDVEHLEQLLRRHRRGGARPRRITVATDGVFGMDGEIAPLPDICEAADRHDAAVIIDDAHATGVMGRNGRGTVDHFGLHGRIGVQVGTLSKALGAVGGFVGGGTEVRDRLARSHPILYSSLLPPALAAASIAAIGILQAEPQRVTRLWSNTSFLRTRLAAAGFASGDSETPIIPIYLSSTASAMRFADRLRELGVLVQAIGYPIVAADRPRLRLIVRSELSKGELAQCADAIEQVGRQLGVVGG